MKLLIILGFIVYLMSSCSTTPRNYCDDRYGLDRYICEDYLYRHNLDADKELPKRAQWEK